MKEILGDELMVDNAQLLFYVDDSWWIRFSHRTTQTADTDDKLAQEAMDALKDACAAMSDHKFSPPLAVPATPEAVYYSMQAAQEFVANASSNAPTNTTKAENA
jgi:hypothetical protein